MDGHVCCTSHPDASEAVPGLTDGSVYTKNFEQLSGLEVPHYVWRSLQYKYHAMLGRPACLVTRLYQELITIGYIQLEA
jgi:hypothetical protein